jgi:hypothetical protein
MQVLLRADDHRHRNDGLLEVRHHYQHICRDDGDQSKQTETLLPEFPAFSILHALEKKTPEWIDRRLTSQAIINVLVILVRFEPEFVRIAKEE